VNAADPTGGGFVTGTAADRSLFATLTAVGIPSEAVALVPLMAVGGVLLLAVLVPFLILGTRRARDFAVALALAGGLWPGIHAFAAGLRRPGLIVAGFGVALVVLLLLRMGRVRRSLVPLRRRIPFILIVAASLAIAIGGDAGPLTSAVLLVFASALLTSPLRVVLRGLVRPPARRAAIEAIAIVAAFAGSGLLWWNPPQSVPGFHAAREATAALRRPLEWIRANVDPREILIASPSYSIPIAALGQRRVLWPPPGGDSGALPEPFRRARLYESVLRGRPNDRLADRFNATYLLLGPGEPTPRVDREQALAAEEPVRELILVYEDAEDFRVFRLAKK
jgi:hypothetical protein